MQTETNCFLFLNAGLVIENAGGTCKSGFGFTAKELIGKNISDIFELTPKKSIKNFCRGVFNSKKFYPFSFIAFNKRKICNQNLLIQNLGDRCLQITCTSQNIIEKKIESLNKIAEHLPVPVLCYNNRKEIQFLNASFKDTFTKKHIELKNLEDFYSLIRPPKGISLKNEIANWFKLVSQHRKKAPQSSISKKAWLLCKNGEIRLFEISFSKNNDTVYAIFNDITNNHKKTKALESSETRFRVIANNIPISIGIHDLEGNVVFINRFFTQQIGYKLEDVPTLSDWYKKSQPDPIIRKQLQDHWLGIIEDIRKKKIKKTPNTEASLLCKDGVVRNFSFVFQVQDDFVYVILVDITKRVKAEHEVGEYNKQLQQLTTHLFSIRDQERKQTSQVVQEALGQHLTGLRLEIAWIKKNIEKLTKVEFEGRMQQTLSSMSEIMNKVRKISAGLRPTVLDDLGLVAAVEWYIAEMMKQHPLFIKFISNTNGKKLERELKGQTFRIIQEVLSQIKNSKKAKNVLLELHYRTSKLSIRIVEDGNSFQTVQKKPTLGWLSIRETIRSLSGKLSFKSNNHIYISIPIKLSHEDSNSR